MKAYEHKPLTNFQAYPVEQMMERAVSFRKEMQRRRTIRHFSNKAVPREIIEECLLAAGTAPNGANLQPWHFVVVSDPEIKKQIRINAEQEEWEFYHNRAPQDWLKALEPFGTDEHKPYLEIAPYLIAIFSLKTSLDISGGKVKNYYVNESVGIATGILITGLHHAGLVSLTHTPSPMGFLNEILDRPLNEKPFLLLVTGFPADDAVVPLTTKKGLEEITTFL